MSTRNLRLSLAISTMACAALLMSSTVHGVTIMRDAVPGAGIVNVDGGLPLILGAPVGSPLEIDVIFNDMKHIELMASATTTLEFGVGNTGNTADVDWRFIFDLMDENGNLLTAGAIDMMGSATGGVIQVKSLDLTPLPPVTFHGFHITVESSFDAPNTGSDRFDLYVAGGGGDPGTFVSGPIRFNRAVVGTWVPEPSSIALGLLGLVACGLRRRR